MSATSSIVPKPDDYVSAKLVHGGLAHAVWIDAGSDSVAAHVVTSTQARTLAESLRRVATELHQWADRNDARRAADERLDAEVAS